MVSWRGLTKSSSEFGVELDSLSDLVSFGVAPSFMIYRIGLHTLRTDRNTFECHGDGLRRIRLARFNVQLVGFDKEYFKGLPIPSSAIVISSFVLSFYDRTMGALDADALFLPFIADFPFAPYGEYCSLRYDSEIQQKCNPFTSAEVFCFHDRIGHYRRDSREGIFLVVYSLYNWRINSLGNRTHQSASFPA